LSGISVKHNDLGRFIERRLGDSLSLFDSLSGETHLIVPPATILIEFLKNFSGTRAKLVQEMMLHIDGTEPEVRNFIDRTLGNLQDIGLIEIKELS